jgi:hypothetical protein
MLLMIYHSLQKTHIELWKENKNIHNTFYLKGQKELSLNPTYFIKYNYIIIFNIIIFKILKIIV